MSYAELKDKLFKAVVKEHINFKKPIGSKILARKNFRSLSPATLRLYLSRLVKEGLLENVGFSLGKRPTDTGWYYYFETTEEKTVPFPFLEDLEKSLSEISQRFAVITYLWDVNFKVNGLTRFMKEHSVEIKAVEEALWLLENIDKFASKINNGVELLIGRDLKENLALLSFKNNKVFLSFLMHKRIDYPVIWSVFKQILIKNFNVRPEKPRRTKRNTSGRAPIALN